MDLPFSWLFFIAMIVFLSMKILKQDERMVVFRLGRFLKVAGPGLVWLIPAIDKGTKVNLSKDFLGWQAWSQIELEEKIKASILDKTGEDKGRN